MKENKFLKILIILVLLIPSYLAIYNISLIASDKLTADNVTKVVVTGANNTQYEYKDRNDIKIYIQIVENARIVDDPIRDLDSEESFNVSFYKGQNQIDYKLYLSQNTDDCLMRATDANRTLLLLRKNDAEKLLGTPLADSLYRYNNIPTLRVIYDDGANITEAYPSKGEWFLKKPNNVFVLSNVQNIYKETNNIKAARGKFLDFKFNMDDPDFLNITIYDDKQIIFDGSYESFHNFVYDTNASLQYVVTVEWHKNEYMDYYGEATYTLDVEYSIPPTFEISTFDSNSAQPGEIVIVTAWNMSDRDSPTIKTDMDYTANFLKIDERHIALLPISLGSMGKDFNIELSGSSVAEDREYKIYVNQITYTSDNTKNLGAQTEMFNAHKSTAAIESKQNSYNTIFASESPNKIYWISDPQFMIPHEGDIILGYGWNITVNMGALTQNKGVNISAAQGSPVAAANSGKVVFVGTVPDDGNLIVIDHGGGVRSWYGHLGTVSVSAGDEVSKGQQIAVSGTSGLYTNFGANLYFAISVHNVFVNPLAVIQNGILPE